MSNDKYRLASGHCLVCSKHGCHDVRCREAIDRTDALYPIASYCVKCRARLGAQNQGDTCDTCKVMP